MIREPAPEAMQRLAGLGEHTDVAVVSGEETLTVEDGQKLAILVEDEATVVERGTGSYVVQVFLSENASLKYFSASTGTVRRIAHLEQDASILWVDAAFGADVNAEVVSRLAGQGASAEFESVLLGTGKGRYVVRSSMVHAADNTTSNMITRAVMFDESRGDYAGTIQILPDARGCDAYQKEDTLLMSGQARMDAQPNLEISNEDVRCSHGASLGRIDEEKIFYFLSRGIGREEAVKLIVQGFFDSILDRMGRHGEQIRDDIMAKVDNG